MAQEKVRVIRVKMDDKTRAQAKAIEKNLMGIDRSLKRTAKSANFLKRAFVGISTFSFAGIGFRSLLRISDNMQLLTDKMSLFKQEGEDSLAIMQLLGDAASRQGQTIDGLAQVYARLGVALKSTGISSKELVSLTEALAQSFRISGATGAEVVATSIQLSQAFASGELRGQELRSVVEQNAALAQALQEKFGLAGDGIEKASESIFRFAEKRGGITAAEAIEAIADQIDNWEKQTKLLNFTLGQTFSILTNKLKLAWNEYNKNLKISETLSQALLFVTKNLTVAFSTLAGLVSSAVLVKYSGAILGAVASVKAFIVSLFALGTSLSGIATALTLALVPLAKSVLLYGSLAAAVGLATLALIDFDKFQKLVSLGMTFITEKVGEFTVIIVDLIRLIPGLADKIGKVDLKRFERLGRQLIKSAKIIRKDLLSKGEETIFEGLKKDFESFLAKLGGNKFQKGLKGLNQRLQAGKLSIEQYRKELRKLRIEEIEELFKAGKISEFDKIERIRRLSEDGKKLSQTTANLAKLNAEFISGAKDVEAYFEAMDTAKLADLQERFKKGSIDLGQLKAKEFESEMKKINMAFRDGAISFGEFSKQVDEIRLEELDYKLRANIISIREYNEQLVQMNDKFRAGAALSVGAERYIQRIGSVSNQVADAIAATFSRLEDSLLDFIKKGRFEFAKFTQAILDDLTRIIIRATIIRPLAEGVLGAFGGGGAGTLSPNTGGGGAAGGATAGGASNYATSGYAKGGAFGANGVQFFASGGVINSPTMFAHSSGLGVAGEAGPEVIAPLRRDSQGNMGVGAVPANVIINVNNQSGAEVQQSETTNDRGERVIELLVVNTVKNGLAQGDFDKQFSNNFGLNRKR